MRCSETRSRFELEYVEWSECKRVAMARVNGSRGRTSARTFHFAVGTSKGGPAGAAMSGLGIAFVRSALRRLRRGRKQQTKARIMVATERNNSGKVSYAKLTGVRRVGGGRCRRATQQRAAQRAVESTSSSPLTH